MKKGFLWLLLALLVYGAIEGISAFGLAQLKGGLAGGRHSYYPADTLSAHHRQVLTRLMSEEPPYTVFDPDIGWAIRPNGRVDHIQRKRKREFSYVANSQGFRADRDYAHAPPAELLRIATFGDSFTHCDDVALDDSWQAGMMARDPGLEVLNFGVGGYGLDQAYLRYQSLGKHFNPDIVVIGFMSENIRRNVNVYRGFYLPEGNQPLTKPRYRVENGELVLLPNPMRQLSDYQRLLDDPDGTLAELGRHDMIYRVRYRSGPFDWSPAVRLLKLVGEKLRRRHIGDGIIDDGVYNTSSEAFDVMTGLIDAFHAEAVADGARPVVVIFASPSDLQDYTAGKPRRYGPLIEYLDERRYRYVDTLDPIVAGLGTNYEINELFYGHYSPLANVIVAEAIVEHLRQTGIRDSALEARSRK